MKHVSFFWYSLIIILSVSATAHATKVGINNTGCTYSTIQAAVDAASDGDTLQVSVGTYNEGVRLSGKNLVITGGFNSTCSSIAGGITTIDGGGSSGTTVYINGGIVVLKNLTITGGSNPQGGGILAFGSADVTLDSTKVRENFALYGGGVSVSSSSTVRIANNSDISANTAGAEGGVHIQGGIFISDASISIQSNSAPNGGGIFILGPNSEAQLNGSTISLNEATAADGKGGGIYAESGTISLSTYSIILQNTAYDGAGIYGAGATIKTIGGGKTVLIQSNVASHYGGGVYLANSSFNMGSSNFIDFNDALVGGGIYAIDNSTVSLKKVRMLLNESNSSGGSIFIQSSNLNIDSGRFELNDADADNNNSGNGGAIYGSNANLTANGVAFLNNFGRYGGAIYQTGASSQASINNCLFSNNSISGTIGAAIRILQGNITLNHSTLAENSGGHALTLSASYTKNIYNSIFANNTGGGVEGTITDKRCNIDQSGNAGDVVNPQFVSLASDDYHLQETSPAIDACSSSGLTNDLEGKHRPIGGMYDMGAYEYGTYFPWTQFLPAILNSRE